MLLLFVSLVSRFVAALAYLVSRHADGITMDMLAIKNDCTLTASYWQRWRSYLQCHSSGMRLLEYMCVLTVVYKRQAYLRCYSAGGLLST